MNMTMPKVGRKRMLTMLGVLVLLVGGVVAAFYIPAAVARDVVTWEPSSIDVILQPGETKTIPVSFTSRRTIRNAMVVVPPELQDFVTPRPAVIPRVSARQTVDIDLDVSVPIGQEPTEFFGTLELHQEHARGGSRIVSRARQLPFSGAVVGRFAVSPLRVTADTAATVFAEIALPSKPVRAALQRVHPDGQIETLALLLDGGLASDANATDGIYAAKVSLEPEVTEVIELRALIVLTGPSKSEYISPVETILVLPPVPNLEAEAFLAETAHIFLNAKSVDDVRAHVSPNVARALEDAVAAGFPLSEVGTMLADAQLLWKTETSAEFGIEPGDTGPQVPGFIVVRKTQAGWRIDAL